MTDKTQNEIDHVLGLLESSTATDLHLQAAHVIRSLREANAHFRSMLNCPDCGLPVWECHGVVIGCKDYDHD